MAIQHFCHECGSEVSAKDEYCSNHPDSMIDSVMVTPTKPLTLQQRIVRYLEHYGYTELAPNKTRRYRTFKPPKTYLGEEGRLYFVGKAGAVRTSKTGHITQSRSISEMFMTYVEKFEKEQGL